MCENEAFVESTVRVIDGTKSNQRPKSGNLECYFSKNIISLVFHINCTFDRPFPMLIARVELK